MPGRAVVVEDLGDLGPGVALARQVGHRRDRRLLAHPGDDLAGALAAAAAGAVGHRDEARAPAARARRWCARATAGRRRSGAGRTRTSTSAPRRGDRTTLAMAAAHATGLDRANQVKQATRKSVDQCRKWRSPVKTMAMPCSSAASIDLGVADAAAGLDDGRDAGRGGDVEAVAEREEGVAGAHPADGPVAGSIGGDAGRVDAVLLTGADAERPGRRLAYDDGVGADGGADRPGELEVVPLLGRSARSSVTTHHARCGRG